MERVIRWINKKLCWHKDKAIEGLPIGISLNVCVYCGRVK
jgi:hypothetical protein